MDPFKEKAVGCALALGFVLMFGSGAFGYAFGTAGMYQTLAARGGNGGDLNLLPLVFLFFAIGVALCVGSVFYGLYFNRQQTSGKRRTVADALILSRYALSPQGAMLSDWELEGADDPRFYVRMKLPDGRASEYPVAPEAYFSCGEGMAGEAELQGKWLGRFTPYIGARPSV